MASIIAPKKRPVPDVCAHPAPSAILPSIWWVGRGPWGGWPTLTSKGDCNIYLVKGAKFDVLVDCGFGASPTFPSALKQLEKNILAAGSEPSRVREIWLTHSHYDHFTRASHWETRHPGITCRIARLAWQYIRRGNHRLISELYLDEKVDFKIPQRLLPVDAGDMLSCPPFRFKVVALPGHVPDGIGFRGRVDGWDAMFTGDAIIGDQNEVKGVFGWIDGFWQSDLTELLAMFQRVARSPPEVILPGHGLSHVGASSRASLRHCIRRAKKILSIPNIEYMGPYVKHTQLLRAINRRRR